MRADWVARLRWLPYAIVAVGALAMFGQTAEDPFITLRYADNLRHGHGPVFNVGERVEGFTSPLHLLVALLAIEAPGGTPLLWLKVASLAFALLAIREVGRLTKAVGGTELAEWLAQLLVATNLAVWTVAGNALETSLWCWLLLWFLRLALDDTRTGGWRRSALAAVAALLARPDMVVIGPAVVAARLYLRRSRADRAAVLRFAVVLGGVLAALTAARLAYYGRPLPNTYFAKAGPLVESIRSGLSYLLDGVGTDAIAHERSSAFRLVGLLANAVWVVPAVAGIRRAATRDRPALVVTGAVLGGLAVVVRAGGDWMRGSRFLVPLLCLLTPFAGCWLADRIAATHSKLAPRARWAPVAAIAAGVLFTQVFSPHHPWWGDGFATDDRSFVTQGPGPFPAFWVAASDLLDRCAQPGWVVAGSEMGYVPFHHPQLRFFDLRGLVTEETTHVPAELKGTAGVTDEHWDDPTSPVGEKLLARQPELILTFDAPPYQEPPATAVGGRYRAVARIPSPSVPEVLYVRSDLPAC